MKYWIFQWWIGDLDFLLPSEYFSQHLGEYENVLSVLEELNITILKAMDKTKKVSKNCKCFLYLDVCPVYLYWDKVANLYLISSKYTCFCRKSPGGKGLPKWLSIPAVKFESIKIVFVIDGNDVLHIVVLREDSKCVKVLPSFENSLNLRK